MNRRIHMPERGIKLLVLVCAYVFLAYQLMHFEHWDEVSILRATHTAQQFFFLFLVVLLMPVNWILETIKWRFLISPIIKTSVKQAFHSVYLGLVAGLVTPGKVGDWPGRAMPFAKEHRSLIAVTGVFNSLVKTLALSITGMGAWLLYALSNETNPRFLNSEKLLVPALISVTALVLFFLLSRRVVTALLKLIKRKKNTGILTEMTWINVGYRSTAFGLSVSRVLIFSLQFSLLAAFFMGDDFSGSMVLLTPIYFFTVTFIPAFALSDPGIRGSVALLLFGGAGLGSPLVAVTGVVLWVINVVVPFLLGQLVFGKQTVSK